MTSEQKKLMILAGLPLLPYPVVCFLMWIRFLPGGMSWISHVSFWIIASYPITYFAAWFFVSESNSEKATSNALIGVASHLIVGFIAFLFYGF